MLATYDPGWNDPPPMPTGDVAVKSNRTKLNLNKRVAFPLQGGTSTASQNVKTTAEGLPLPFSTAKYQPPPMTANQPPAQSILLPPPTANQTPVTTTTQPVLLPPPPTAASTSAAPSEIIPHANQDIPSDLTSNDMHELCQKTFSTLAEKMAAIEEPSKLHEIQKRLDIFNKMWTDNKFTELVQQKLYDIAKGLYKLYQIH